MIKLLYDNNYENNKNFDYYIMRFNDGFKMNLDLILVRLKAFQNYYY